MILKRDINLNFITFLISLVVAIATISCTKNGSTDTIPTIDDSIKQPRVIASGNKLITSDGKPFKVWGFNYGAGSDEGLMEAHSNNEAT